MRSFSLRPQWIVSVALGLMLVLASSLTFASSLGSMPSDGILDFDIVRNGHPIGTQTYRFEPEGNRLAVDIQTRIDYRLLFIPVYRFEHRSRELWQEGRIRSVASQTDDNGTPARLSAVAAGTLLHIEGQEDQARVERALTWDGTAPDSLWNVRTVDAVQLFSSIDGEPMRIEVEDLGSDVIEVAGRSVPARHFRITGEYERELWYDATGLLLGVRFTASDGSTVQYVPRRLPVAAP